ncbi:MAG: hypothetical protein H7176_04965 [Bdellovibrionales bacterium]|nr:hypothetical protein [Massilia sp.]
MTGMDAEAAVAPDAAPAPRPSFLNWIREGARTLVFMRPRWVRVRASPGAIACLLILDIFLGIGISRLYIDGPATFHWRAGLAGWAAFVLAVWACYAVLPRPRGANAEQPLIASDAAHLMTMLVAQALALAIVWGCASLLLLRSGLMEKANLWVYWGAWLFPAIWGTLAVLLMLFRAGERRLTGRLQAVCAIALSVVITNYLSPSPQFWHAPAKPEAAEEEPIRFTQELVELQAQLMQEQVGALKPQRPGIADMYTLTFAPYEGEEVFRRESRMVNDVMARRFDAAGRGLQLLNHREHLDNMLWATPLNMQRAIAGIAAKMNTDEDVLFIHLTSHGARGGELAANFWPLDAEAITPADLRKWLDEAGIRHRVISISACYSGSWIDPLANEDTLVMTAADAEHTSYGCGRKSPLTFFGRAMYDEQLRTSTLSFEQAHAAARKIIAQREKEAGKDDGYSNPQIKVGSRIRPYLDKLRERLGQQAR